MEENENKPKQLKEENNERANRTRPTNEKDYVAKKKQIQDFRNHGDVNNNQHYYHKYPYQNRNQRNYNNERNFYNHRTEHSNSRRRYSKTIIMKTIKTTVQDTITFKHV